MDKIRSVDVFPVVIPRDTPYLGLRQQVNEKDYFIHPGNKSIYSIHDQSLVIRLISEDGATGWGEAYGMFAPQVTATILRELVIPQIIGRDPHDVIAIHDDLYDMMRVRGYLGGYYLDALAGIDIALWDLRGKLLGLPLAKLLGAERKRTIRAYVSGLPRDTQAERAALAKDWIHRGFDAVKIAACNVRESEVEEMMAVREAVGSDAKILMDLHWGFTAPQAIRLINRLDQFDLHLAEAPVEVEDLEGLARVAQSVRTSVGVGEEFRTIHEFRPLLTMHCMDVVQPEMGRMGITEFCRVCAMAQAFHCTVMPHATTGVGLFLAASLHASAGLTHLSMHEYQHSIFDRNLQFLSGNMRCEKGFYHIPDGPGLGVEPTEELLRYCRPG